MQLKFYNTLTRKKEIFKPIRKDGVGLYTCGPTMYNFVHIGNLRTYIFQDILKRALLYSGLHVRHVMNLTDVDDKTIQGARASEESLKTFTRRYEKIFKEDLKKLTIVSPEKFTRATEHIPAMIAMISALLKNGTAYQKDGSVYFDVSKFALYGKLARLDIKGLRSGTRVDTDEYEKDEARDFVLWKAAKKNEPSWKAPFGRGRPGWHIECSAMSLKYLEQPFDIHTGGVDLIFPHHENEIAQSEAAYGKQFVRFWMHGEHLLVNGEKMSKSLGNIVTLRDVESRGFDSLAFRYLVLGAHYRSKLNFTWDSLSSAARSLERIAQFVLKLKRERARTRTAKNTLYKFQKQFIEAISDDLDTPKALSIIWEAIHAYNEMPARFNPKAVRETIYDFDRVFGLGLKRVTAEKIPARVTILAKRREKLREEKKWKEADVLRNTLEELGWVIEDRAEGYKLKSKKRV